MRRQAQGQMVRWVSRTAAMAAGAAALFATGCVRSRPEPGLLGGRTLVPAPFVEPAAAAPSAVLPAEPAFTGTTVVPAGAAIIPAAPLDENLVMTPVDSLDDVKPVKSSTGKSGAAPRTDGERQTYIVKKGDSLWLIARRYGVTVAELTAENSISESKVLKIGQSIALPRGARFRDVPAIKHTAPRQASATSSSKPRTTSAAKPSTGATKSATASSGSSRKAGKEPIPADGMYTIKSGDNPWDLSRKFGVKHEELMQWNSLKSDTVLQVGQKIRLRSGASESAAATAAVVPTVKPAVPAVAPEATATATGAVLTEAPLAAPATGTVPVVGAETPAAPAPAATLPADTMGAAPAGALGPATTVAPAIPAGALDLPKKLSHSVTEGETLQIIAEMYGTTVDAIKKENPTIKTDADLLPNLKLMVPYR